MDNRAPVTAAIDMRGALGRMGGNRELLGRLIAEFSEKEADAAQEAEALLNAGCLTEAIRRVHTAKGTAMILGLDGFSTAAGRVEKALLQGDRATARILWVPFAQELAAAIDACAQQRAAAEDEDGEVAAMPASGAVQPLLEQLAALLDRNSMTALEVVHDLRVLLRDTPHRGAIADIDRCLDQLDFAAARRLAGQLMNDLIGR